jgi:hypothetical protein
MPMIGAGRHVGMASTPFLSPWLNLPEEPRAR